MIVFELSDELTNWRSGHPVNAHTASIYTDRPNHKHIFIYGLWPSISSISPILNFVIYPPAIDVIEHTLILYKNN